MIYESVLTPPSQQAIITLFWKKQRINKQINKSIKCWRLPLNHSSQNESS